MCHLALGLTFVESARTKRTHAEVLAAVMSESQTEVVMADAVLQSPQLMENYPLTLGTQPHSPVDHIHQLEFDSVMSIWECY